jgi:hypothetical protein
MSGPETLFVPWIRPAIPGEQLEDQRERRCESLRCGAVFRRQQGEGAESWATKRYYCAACWSGQPPIPKQTKDREE